ncbi:hypothetical protein SAMN05660653_02203 [Desulfonatronum thiosulfatophilum]|uniref:Uncharacterized protein n=1 Tax=Desulfonatronum thiosulfatophilum TaxID=617002 RepID=A0A1G6DJJ5_9BACT|nr:hypothetical protein [Desulfonatronum thiosulfatophilum]SDB45308.1 hypothetical protein SAMN05660653_02203 [Desulfonatronum thiosulfatophilum]
METIGLDKDEATILAAPTSDRSALMERLRHGLLRQGEDMPYSVQEALFSVTSLFERTIWLLSRYLALIAPPTLPTSLGIRIINRSATEASQAPQPSRTSSFWEISLLCTSRTVLFLLVQV